MGRSQASGRGGTRLSRFRLRHRPGPSGTIDPRPSHGEHRSRRDDARTRPSARRPARGRAHARLDRQHGRRGTPEALRDARGLAHLPPLSRRLAGPFAYGTRRAMAAQPIIRIEDAKAQVRVGVPDPERAAPQEVSVSVSLARGDPANFAGEDRLSLTVDYDRIIHFIRDDLGAPAHLIETLADRVARHCLSLSSNAQWVEVTVKKPSVMRQDGMVAVTIRREKA